jgi:hypothetical protein
MPSLESGMPAIRQMDIIQCAWDRIRAQLETEKARIYEVIVNYPPPIAACDQQFNYLLEERTRISRELDRLNKSSTANLPIEDSIKLIDEFIRSSSYVDPETEQTIQSYLEAGLSQL